MNCDTFKRGDTQEYKLNAYTDRDVLLLNISLSKHHISPDKYEMDVNVSQSLLISVTVSVILCPRMTAHVFTLKAFWGTK